MKTVYFIEAFKNIKKNLVTSLLLILCFLVLFILFAETSLHSVMKSISGKHADMVSLVEYSQISLIPFTSVRPTEQLMALNTLSNEEIYEVGRTIDIIRAGLLNTYGAYECRSNISIYGQQNDEVAKYCTNDIYAVSSSLLIIADGEWFDENDFNVYERLNKNYISPVLLGAKFAEKYGLSVGDVFIADMFFDEEDRKYMDEDGQSYTWRVIGIFEPDSSYIARSGINPVDRRVLLPDAATLWLDDVLTENGGEINENVLSFISMSLFFNYFQGTDFFIKQDYMESAVEFVNNNIRSNAFLSQYYIAKEGSDAITMAAQNQSKASEFYNAAALITYIISVFGIMMSVNTKIQNNKHNYAIHSLNGAATIDLIMCSITEILVLMLVADAFFFAFPYRTFYFRVTMGNGEYIGREAPIFVLAVNLATFVFAAVVSSFVLRKFDTAGYLKKKE